LAKRYDGEIINGDAMQMYDGLPIITNKVTVEEQQGITHHLLGIVALDDESWRVGKFKQRAGQIIREIRSRGRLPIVVGGTHYYTQSLLFADSLVTKQADSDEETELSNLEIFEKFPILSESAEVMLEHLREVDPVMAKRWHPNDKRKIRRSLEIFLLTGKKASEIYAAQNERKIIGTEEEIPPNGPGLIDSTLLFWVHSDAEVLKARLDDRVDKMIEAGLLDEVKSMESFLQDIETSGINLDRTRGIWVSIGWKEFEPYLKALESGIACLEELQALYDLSVEQVQTATRQYARRQVRWIRLKLMPALLNEKALDKLYLLDGTDVAQWNDNVSNPAISITEKFLNEQELPAPHTLSAAAQEFLDPDSLEEKPALVFQECQLCCVATVTDDQWQAHLKSRRHRGVLKKKQKIQRMIESGRSPHPPSDNISPPDTP
jgi:tRNA dimethylallyltransferase